METTIAVMFVIFEAFVATFLFVQCYKVSKESGIRASGFLTASLACAASLAAMGMTKWWQFLLGMPLMLLAGFCGSLLALLVVVSVKKHVEINENMIIDL